MSDLIDYLTTIADGQNVVRNKLIDIWGTPVLWQNNSNSQMNEVGEMPSYPILSEAVRIYLVFPNINYVSIINTITSDYTEGVEEESSVDAAVRSDIPVNSGDKITITYKFRGLNYTRPLLISNATTIPYITQFTSRITLVRWKYSV
jgi:hypothetical protein